MKKYLISIIVILMLQDQVLASSCKHQSEVECTYEFSEQNTLEAISRAGFKVLKDEDLLKRSPLIYTTIFCDVEGYDQGPIEFDDKEIVTDIRVSRMDLFLKILSINEGEARVMFKSFDDGGYEHNGKIMLMKEGEAWIKKSINYITAIE